MLEAACPKNKKHLYMTSWWEPDMTAMTDPAMIVEVATRSLVVMVSSSSSGAKMELDTRVREPKGAIKLWGANTSAATSAKLPMMVRTSPMRHKLKV